MSASWRHIALYVQDLQAGEKYYQELLGMNLLMREAKKDDSLWYTLPLDKNWEDAIASGIDLEMVALKKDEIVLVLFSGDAALGQVHTIGVRMAIEGIADVRSRLTNETEVIVDKSERLEIRDKYGIVWQIWTPSIKFLPNGESGRWLSL